MSDAGNPQWKPWMRWPFLLAIIAGATMIVVGVRECVSLAAALRTMPSVVVVNTAMSAFPPLGIGIMAAGLLGWLPRTADGRQLRRIKIRGVARDPGVIVVGIVLICLLLYPIAGIALRAATSNMLSTRGYTETTERVSASSSYITSRWTRRSVERS